MVTSGLAATGTLTAAAAAMAIRSAET